MVLPKTYGSFMQNFSPSVPCDYCYGRNLQKFEKFEIRNSNIRIVEDLIQDLWVIHAKFQPRMITVTAVISKNSKNSEKFELRISNFRKVEDLTQDLWVIHANFQPRMITVTAVIGKNSKNSE